MTIPARPGSANPMYMFVKLQKLKLVIGLLLSIIAVRVFSAPASASSSSGSPSGSIGTKIKAATASVTISTPYGSGPGQNQLDFVQCGKAPTATASEGANAEGEGDILELMLLHGAKYTKEDWVTSGILEFFCLKGGHKINVVALDLSISADGNGLYDAFNALVGGNVLSGKPVTVISPSASGKSVVDLTLSTFGSEDRKNIFRSIISSWIPVASPAVLRVREKNEHVFSIFQSMGIPVLAINGKKDAMGKKVTDMLVHTAGAIPVELKGGHPCYLDSPNEFVDSVLSFLYGEKDQS